jgi:hypothetical protein
MGMWSWVYECCILFWYFRWNIILRTCFLWDFCWCDGFLMYERRMRVRFEYAIVCCACVGWLVDLWVSRGWVECVLHIVFEIFRSALPGIFISGDCGSSLEAVMCVWIWMIVTKRRCVNWWTMICLHVYVCAIVMKNVDVGDVLMFE